MLFLITFVVCLVNAKSERYYEMIKDINEKKEYYSILGVERDAEYPAIKRAHKLGIIKYHPDKNKDPESLKMFLDIQKAFEILSENETKSEYDTLLTEGIPLHEQYYGRYMHRWGAPQHDIRYVLLWTLVILTVAKHLYQRHRHYDMISRAKQTQRYQDAQKELRRKKERELKSSKGAEKSGKENGAEADEKELDVEVAIEVKGAPLPTWRDLLPVQLFMFIIYLPQNSYNFLIFVLAVITGQKPWAKTQEELMEERRIQLGMSEEEWAKAVAEQKQKARMKMNSNKAKIYQRWLKKQNK